MSSLNQHTALITGASSGIGQACAKHFAAAGIDKLILIARRTERLTQLASELERHSVKTHTLTLDVRDNTAINQAIKSLPEAFRHISILINNAGLALTTDSLANGKPSNWDTMIDTNIKGVLYVTRAVLPGMLSRQEGHIINIGSIAGHQCYPGGNVYCATKHAVKALSQSLRLDLVGKPLRVTSIDPGMVETEFSTVRWNDEKKATALYAAHEPLQADDIAKTVVFAATQPQHVNIAEMIVMPTSQASATSIAKKQT